MTLPTNTRADTDTDFALFSKALSDRILHILDCFPKVSPSMLQISLGSGVPTALWHAVLETLIAEGQVCRYTISRITPAGRTQLQTVISLTKPGTHENVVECDTESGT